MQARLKNEQTICELNVNIKYSFQKYMRYDDTVAELVHINFLHTEYDKFNKFYTTKKLQNLK